MSNNTSAIDLLVAEVHDMIQSDREHRNRLHQELLTAINGMGKPDMIDVRKLSDPEPRYVPNMETK